MAQSTKLYWNRDRQRLESENVQGSAFLKWSFTHPVGRLLLHRVFSSHLFSRIFYGWFLDRRLSCRWIQPFIAKYRISMTEFEETSYSSFNEFFIRRYRKGARPFSEDPNVLPAFAEGKMLGYTDPSHSSPVLPVKGLLLTPSQILGGPSKALPFEGGPVIICRLRPDDYHRFHYPDDGLYLERYRIHGSLHATNPACYQYKSDVLLVNERQISVLNTINFALLAYVEVGAMGVGRIIQNSSSSPSFKRGEEKGYFQVGGSTVLVFGQRGRWLPTQDLLSHTTNGLETQIFLGQPIGRTISRT